MGGERTGRCLQEWGLTSIRKGEEDDYRAGDTNKY